MKTTDINNLIKELDGRINYWAENRQLFCGGCCYSAYLLARGFEKLGIKYTTVIYQSGDNWNTNRYSKVTNGDGCGHVAIRVVYKHKKMTIGSSSDVNQRLETAMSHHGPWMKREYAGVNSKMLKETYYSNDWNWIWNTGLNGSLANDINRIFRKYM